MENKKSFITIVLIAGLAVAAGAFALSLPGKYLPAYLSLTIVAAVIGWYIGAGSKSAANTESPASSIIDELTGLHAYNYFIDRLNEERKRSDRFGSRCSMILVEIDDFKSYSDERGRQVGKDLIKNIGETIKVQVRGVDIVSRYSDAQFGVLLPNTGRMASHEVAERIRLAVEQGKFGANGNGGQTVSVGLATYPDQAGDDVQLIEHAGEALSKAKATGKNCVIVFGSEISEQRAAT
jgi:diguanylate cyclase (GGDEF)-like protein